MSGLLAFLAMMQKVVVAVVVTASPYKWNSADKSSRLALADAGRTLVRTVLDNTSYRTARGQAALAGKSYWEVRIPLDQSAAFHYQIGIAAATASLELGVGTGGGDSYSYAPAEGAMYNGGSNGVFPPGSLPAAAAGDVFMFAFDAATLKFWVGRNGAWFNSGDPTAGTGAQWTVSAGAYFPASSIHREPMRLTANFFEAHQQYAIPSGFVALASGDAGQQINPKDIYAAAMGLADGIRTLQQTGSYTWCSGRALLPVGTEKRYFEVKIVAGLTNNYFMMGVGKPSVPLTSYAGQWDAWVMAIYSGYLYHNNGGLSSGWPSTWADGDVVNVAVDGATGKIWYGKNGTYFAGDPAAGTGAMATCDGALYPMLSTYQTGTIIKAAFQRDDFTYAPPAGFAGWGPLTVGPLKFDPVNVGPGMVIDGDRALYSTSTGNARGLTGKSAGKWQFECVATFDPDLYAMIGIATGTPSSTGYPGTHANSWGLWNRTGNIYNNGAAVGYGVGYGTGAVVGCVVDMDAGTAKFYLNGTVMNGGTPAVTGLTGVCRPMVGNGGGGSSLRLVLSETLAYPVAGATQWNDA